MKRYAIVIEQARLNFGGYVPDLPGCVATGSTVEETESLLREAIGLHLDGMRRRRNRNSRAFERRPNIWSLRRAAEGCYFQRQEVGKIRAAERIAGHSMVENGTKPFGQAGSARPL